MSGLFDGFFSNYGHVGSVLLAAVAYLLHSNDAWNSNLALLFAVLTPVMLFAQRQSTNGKDLKLSKGFKEAALPADCPSEGPLCWSFLPSQGTLRANMPKAVDNENDLAILKFLVLHRPTHDPATDASGLYPYSWHFEGRKRLWEVRVQLRFKKLPAGPIHFGLEMRHVPGHKKSYAVQQTQKLILGACRAAIGKDFYQTAGDDPLTTNGEAEPPTFSMPLWTVDQYHVAEAGEEPDITGDLEGIGRRRTEGLRAYIQAFKQVTDNLSTEKVYTFCFWGVSQVVDVINWELKGLWPGFRMDANKLCGSAPIYVVAYELQRTGRDERHLISRKNYYFKVAVWSGLKSPHPDELLEVTVGSPSARNSDLPQTTRRRDSVSCNGSMLKRLGGSLKRFCGG